jgi:hypothetical protein
MRAARARAVHRLIDACNRRQKRQIQTQPEAEEAVGLRGDASLTVRLSECQCPRR